MSKFRALNIKHEYLPATPDNFQKQVEKALTEMGEEVGAQIQQTTNEIAETIAGELKTNWLRSNSKHKHIADCFDTEQTVEQKLPVTLIGNRKKGSQIIRYHELGYRVDKKKIKTSDGKDLREHRKKFSKDEKISLGAKFKAANPIVRNTFDKYMPEVLVERVNKIIDSSSKKWGIWNLVILGNCWKISKHLTN